MSLFLQEAMEAPHLEPEVCERLLEYIEYLVKMDREAYRRKVLACVADVFKEEGMLLPESFLVLNGGSDV